MALDQSPRFDDLEHRVTVMIERLGELQAGERVSSDAYFAASFVREHTEFESFEAFCAASPWTLERPAAIRDVPSAELDAYVARTTEFDSWAAMEEAAATEELVVQHGDHLVA